MDAPRINPDDHLGLVMKRKPEDWGTAYIALSSAALTFDASRGVPFHEYAYKVINWRVFDDKIEDMANRKHRNRTLKRDRNKREKYAGRVYLCGAMRRLRRARIVATVPFVYPSEPAPLKNIANPKLEEFRELIARGINMTAIARSLGLTKWGVQVYMRKLRGAYGTSHKSNQRRNKRGKEEAAHGASDGVPDTPAQARRADHRAA